MARLYVRVNDETKKELLKKAREEGFVKPSGSVNISAYLRSLIKNDIKEGD